MENIKLKGCDDINIYFVKIIYKKDNSVLNVSKMFDTIEDAKNHMNILQMLIDGSQDKGKVYLEIGESKEEGN